MILHYFGINTIDKNAATQYIVRIQSDLSSEKMSGTWKDKRISHPIKGVTLEETRVLLSSSIRTTWRMQMTQTFFKSLTDFLCGQRTSAAYRKDLMTWAKTEYPKDWEFAYHYMLRHNGKAPEYKGITL